MAFEGLSQKLSAALGKLTGRGKLTEQTVKEGVREVQNLRVVSSCGRCGAQDTTYGDRVGDTRHNRAKEWLLKKGVKNVVG